MPTIYDIDIQSIDNFLQRIYTSCNERVKLPRTRLENKTNLAHFSNIIAQVTYQGPSKNNNLWLVVLYCSVILRRGIRFETRV